MTRFLHYLCTLNLRYAAVGLMLGAFITGLAAYFTQDVTRTLLGVATGAFAVGVGLCIATLLAEMNDLDDGPGGSGAAHV